MYSVLLLEKTGNVVAKEIKGMERLFAACHYRNEEGFEELHQWPHQGAVYVLYGKRKGKTPYENHATLPDPLSQSLFYGTLCLLKKVNQELASMTIDEWNKFMDSTVEDVKPEEKELKKEEYEPEPKRVQRV